MTSAAALTQLLVRSAASPNPEKNAEVRTALATSTLILPSSMDGKQLLRVTDPSGRALFLAFTSRDTLQRWIDAQQRTVAWGTINGREAFKTALGLGCSAVVIDSAGPARVEFDQTEIRRIAEGETPP